MVAVMHSGPRQAALGSGASWTLSETPRDAQLQKLGVAAGRGLPSAGAGSNPSAAGYISQPCPGLRVEVRGGR